MNKNTKSVPELLRTLWEEGFFKDAKEISEISGGLAAKGYHLQDSSLGTALMRAVKTGSFLIRVKETGKWKYIQKHPIESASGQRTELFNRYDFHPRIKEVAFSQFENNDFKGAILNAFIEVVDQVKTKTGRPKDKNGKDLDGDDLMNKIFGCDGEQEPKIKFNSLSDGLDKAEQRGLMYLFKGVVGVRDRKAHINFIQNDPLKTIEYLSLASLLLRLLDEHPIALKTRKKKS
ncbi:MAG: TIGR02391 family protein [Candidatus Pacebacteria bacterium]|nr:TIGR02391 family protein [Candidatus Paceibacterota bacterium]